MTRTLWCGIVVERALISMSKSLKLSPVLPLPSCVTWAIYLMNLNHSFLNKMKPNEVKKGLDTKKISCSLTSYNCSIVF